MKNYTDLEQSKKLSEILPIESADMWYAIVDGEPFICLEKREEYENIPAWSLSKLMDTLPHMVIFELKTYRFKMCTDVYSNGEKYYDLGYQGAGYWLEYVDSTDLVDACVEMIIKLKERDLL